MCVDLRQRNNTRKVKEFHRSESYSLPAAILQKISAPLKRQTRNMKSNPESLSNIRSEVLKDNEVTTQKNGTE